MGAGNFTSANCVVPVSEQYFIVQLEVQLKSCKFEPNFPLTYKVRGGIELCRFAASSLHQKHPDTDTDVFIAF